MKIIKFNLFPLIIIIALAISCEKDEYDVSEYRALNREIYSLLKEVYLWNTNIPAVDPGSYANPDDFINAIIYKPLDKWSYIITEDEFNQYFEEGKMIGHGFLLGLDNDNGLRIAFLYRNTEAYNKGVRRSWKINKINGTIATISNVFNLLGPSTIGVQNSFEFIDKTGNTVNLTLTKDEINITPVLDYRVIEHSGMKTGYLAFQDFIDAANSELDEAFEYFINEGIDELVIDMRYNGGGSVDVAEHMVSWLLGNNYADQPFVNFRHNKNYSTYWDTTINIIPNSNNLNLTRLFFIGTSSTASASELVINGTKPYIESSLAGENTHGKPVGMYAFPLTKYNYVVLPITFRYTNANEEGDFYDGLPVDLPAYDDLTRDFGDPEEDCLEIILSVIESGTLALKSTRMLINQPLLLEKKEAINQFLKAY